MITFFGQCQLLHCVRHAAGRVGVDNQVSLLVIAACGTNSCHETLGITVDGIVAVGFVSGLIPGVLGIEHLVIGLEEQMLIIVLKLIGNLRPEVLVAFLCLFVVVHRGNQPMVTLCTGIVMHIQDTVQAVVDDIIYNLMHAFHPFGIHLSVLIHLLEPGYWHSDCFESGISHHLDQFRLGDRLSPKCLVCFGRCKVPAIFALPIGSIQCVTQIPAHAHEFDGVFGIFKIGCLHAHTHQ